MPALIRSVRKVLQQEVENPRGDSLGRVEDLAVDLEAGQIAYALLVYGPGDQPDKRFVVPWSALSFHPDRGRFLLDVDREVLDHSSGIGESDWLRQISRPKNDHVARNWKAMMGHRENP